MRLVLYRITAIAILALLGCSCDSKTVVEKPMYEPPIKSGQVLDKTTEYGKWWTGQPALFKWPNGMVFQIPPMYQRFWFQRDKVAHTQADLINQPTVNSIGLQFFMPDFSGFTPDNYENEFHEDMVNVISIEYVGMGQEQPGAAGRYPPNMYQRMTTSIAGVDPNKYEERFGLRCFDLPPLHTDKRTCYGLRDAASGEHIFLDITVPPYEDWIKYPHMQAHYFSPKYGGVEILWRSHMKNFARWQDIDSQIWKFVDTWKTNHTDNQPTTSTDKK